jgi:hypothetical protein
VGRSCEDFPEALPREAALSLFRLCWKELGTSVPIVASLAASSVARTEACQKCCANSAEQRCSVVDWVHPGTGVGNGYADTIVHSSVPYGLLAMNPAPRVARHVGGFLTKARPSKNTLRRESKYRTSATAPIREHRRPVISI